MKVVAQVGGVCRDYLDRWLQIQVRTRGPEAAALEPRPARHGITTVCSRCANKPGKTVIPR